MSTFTKICGIAFIVFSTSAYGWVLSRDLKRRLLELRELKKIMFLLRGEIGYGMTPLLEAAGSIAQRVTAPFNGILTSLSNRNSEIKECPFGQMWEEEFTKGLVMSHLSAAEKERLVALGNSMGLSDGRTQQNVIDAYMQEVETAISDMEKCLPAKTRLYRSLGVMLGVVISIIII